VREAALFGKPGAAVSHFRRRGQEYDWPRAAAWLVPLLHDLADREVRPGAFWNVNVPHLAPGAPEPEVAFCRLDPHPLPVRFRADERGLHYDGNYHERRREPGCDVDLCFRGMITVTELRLF
jgi:5'-nucleotidase